MQRTIAGYMPASDDQGAVMAYALEDHLGGPDGHIPEAGCLLEAQHRKGTAQSVAPGSPAVQVPNA